MPDKIFGFRPGNGVHDIHMNQGNSGRFRDDDGVWQDGGLLFQFPGEDRWVAIFLAFQSQAWHTDDTTGHAIVDAPTESRATDRCASWPRWSTRSGRPRSRRPSRCSTRRRSPVDLAGWRLADRMKRTCPAPAMALAPGAP